MVFKTAGKVGLRPCKSSCGQTISPSISVVRYHECTTYLDSDFLVRPGEMHLETDASFLLSQAYWETSPDGRSVLLKAARNIAAGEEICDSYGKKGNDELLISYGFITRDNIYEYMALFDTVDAAIDWLFTAFPCRSGPGAEVVSRPSECREEVMGAVRERLLEVPLPPIIRAMQDDPASVYYVSDIPRMSLFVKGTEDVRLTAAFEAAFSQACFLCAWESAPGTSEVAQSIQSAVDGAKELVARASGVEVSSRLASQTVTGRTDLAVKLRVLELLKPLGISFGDEATSTWRKPTAVSRLGYHGKSRYSRSTTTAR